jgi:hypothetical protein
VYEIQLIAQPYWEEYSSCPTLYVVLLQVYSLQEGDEVRPTFPRPVLGAGQNVSARQRYGNALLLEQTQPSSSAYVHVGRDL